MTWEVQAASNMQSTKTSAMEGWIVTSGSSTPISRGLAESSPDFWKSAIRSPSARIVPSDMSDARKRWGSSEPETF